MKPSTLPPTNVANEGSILYFDNYPLPAKGGSSDSEGGSNCGGEGVVK